MPAQDKENSGGDHIQVGNVSGSGIAIGRNASASVTSGLASADIANLFAGLEKVIQQSAPERRQEAEQTVEALKGEVAKGDKSDDSRVAKLIDKLVDLVPGAVSAVVSTFATPILGGIAGPVTKFVLDKLK
jgi:hypothetical protein